MKNSSNRTFFAVIIFFIVLVIIQCFLSSEYQTDAFARKMRNFDGLQEIYQWVITIERPVDSRISEMDYPPALKQLKPKYVDVVAPQWIRISWGGGFGHWGLLMGPSDYPPDASFREYRVRISKGIFSWSEIQRK